MKLSKDWWHCWVSVLGLLCECDEVTGRVCWDYWKSVLGLLGEHGGVAGWAGVELLGECDFVAGVSMLGYWSGYVGLPDGMMGSLGWLLLDYWVNVLGLVKMGIAMKHSERRTLMYENCERAQKVLAQMLNSPVTPQPHGSSVKFRTAQDLQRCPFPGRNSWLQFLPVPIFHR